MKTRFMITGLAMVLLPCCLVAAEINPDLKQVVVALRPVLEKLDPKADITYSNNGTSLVVSYRSQPYKIHGIAMTGEISPTAHDETGPSFNGFVLKVQLQDQGDSNQAVTPQILREPYWETYLEVTSLGGTQKQILWSLSYGSSMDTLLLTQIKKALDDLKERPRR